jgi:hypothetical protein
VILQKCIGRATTSEEIRLIMPLLLIALAVTLAARWARLPYTVKNPGAGRRGQSDWPPYSAVWHIPDARPGVADLSATAAI